MKTIQKKSSIKRVSNEDADKLVKNDGWMYVPKSVWKTQSRDLTPKKEKTKKIKKINQ